MRLEHENRMNNIREKIVVATEILNRIARIKEAEESAVTYKKWMDYTDSNERLVEKLEKEYRDLIRVTFSVIQSKTVTPSVARVLRSLAVLSGLAQASAYMKAYYNEKSAESEAFAKTERRDLEVLIKALEIISSQDNKLEQEK